MIKLQKLLQLNLLLLITEKTLNILFAGSRSQKKAEEINNNDATLSAVLDTIDDVRSSSNIEPVRYLNDFLIAEASRVSRLYVVLEKRR